MGYAAANTNRVGWAQFYQAVREGQRKTEPIPDHVREAVSALNGILSAWRSANPRAASPHWHRELTYFCNANHNRARTACGLFVQQADGITDTRRLLALARQAVRMASCNHETGTWSGSISTASGEYDDNLIFSCPECGYKGS